MHFNIILIFLKLNLILSDISFISIGDWGIINNDQYKTSLSAREYAKSKNSSFIITLGDNFYETGVTNISDNLWNTVYKNNPIYSLNIPWYVTLGNHDYYGNYSAQIDFTNYDNKWKIPKNYYTIILKKQKVKLIIIDTQILDPVCTCVNQNITNEEIKRTHYKWLVTELNTSFTKIIIAHAGIYTVSGLHPECKQLKLLLYPLLKKYNVYIYIHGHDHVLQHNLYDGIHYIGCGSTGKLEHKIIPESFTQFYKIQHGYCFVQINKQSIKIKMINKNSQILNEINIYNHPQYYLIVIIFVLIALIIYLCLFCYKSSNFTELNNKLIPK